MVPKLLRVALVATLLPCFALPALAADSSLVRKSIETYLAQQIKGLPGKASFSVGNIDASRLSDACTGFDTTMAAGARPWGSTYVLVSCRGDNGGNGALRVPVKIQVVADYLVSARPLTAGQAITETDLGHQSGELSVMPTGILMDKEQAIGRVLSNSLPVGRPLRGDMLRQPVVVQQGQSVRVVTVGSGFQVSSEGRALANASIGQVAQVRLNSGQVLSGVARADGSVEIKQ
jgi:flagella basal body P-ring formation protein FlgA